MSSFIASPVVDEWASSMMTANRDPAKSVAAFATTGNFCKVVTMIRAVFPSRASRELLADSVTVTIVPGVWSNPDTVACNCLSSTTRSVMITTLWKIG